MSVFFFASDPSACGLSWTPGQNRALVGAVTDTSGQLISFQDPISQGQVIVVYLTGLSGLTLDATTGLLDVPQPGPLGFGIAQYGTDIPATVMSLFGFQYGLVSTPAPLWAGQSPQFVGLDQINVNFPVCPTTTKATIEKRYDAFLNFVSVDTGTAVRIYFPFLVRVGDADCSWTTQTTTAVTSSANPSVPGQPVTFTATVSRRCRYLASLREPTLLAPAMAATVSILEAFRLSLHKPSLIRQPRQPLSDRVPSPAE